MCDYGSSANIRVRVIKKKKWKIQRIGRTINEKIVYDTCETVRSIFVKTIKVGIKIAAMGFYRGKRDWVQLEIQQRKEGIHSQGRSRARVSRWKITKRKHQE